MANIPQTMSVAYRIEFMPDHPGFTRLVICGEGNQCFRN